MTDKSVNLGKRGKAPLRGWAAALVASSIPILRVAANNVHEGLDGKRLLAWWALFAAAALLLYSFARKADGDERTRWQAIAIGALLVFLMYGQVVSGLVGAWFSPVISLLIAGGLFLIVALATRWPLVSDLILLLPFFLVLAPVIDLIGATPSAEAPEWQATGDLPHPSPVATPNIYWFVLDGYARRDVIEALGGGFDLGAGLGALGFQVDEWAVAPYDFTDLSLAATLSADYLPPSPTFVQLRKVAQEMFRQEFPVTDWFSRVGYRRLHLPGANWHIWRCGAPESICLVEPVLPPEDELVRALTVLGPLSELANPTDQESEIDPVRAVDQVLKVGAQDAARPHLTVIHLTGSHPPYRWVGPDCRFRPASQLSSIWLPIEEYLESARCTGDQVIEAVTRLMEADPEALIIVQGDHGLRLQDEEYEQVGTTVSKDTLRLGVLLAARLPDGCGLGEGNNTVNVFRIVIGCVSGTRVNTLPSRSWKMVWPDVEEAGVPVEAFPDRGR